MAHGVKNVMARSHSLEKSEEEKGHSSEIDTDMEDFINKLVTHRSPFMSLDEDHPSEERSSRSRISNRSIMERVSRRSTSEASVLLDQKVRSRSPSAEIAAIGEDDDPFDDPEHNEVENVEVDHARLTPEDEVRPHVHKWGYGAHGGPAAWATIYPQCHGERQSPISIYKKLTRQMRCRPFSFINYSQPPTALHVRNSGYSAIAEIDLPSPPSLKFGGLRTSYIFTQYHFHWGADSSCGSEHTFDDHAFPMELHLVHYKSVYGSVLEAVKHRDGLCVLGVMFHVSEEDNVDLEPLVDALKKCQEPGSLVTLSDGLPLACLLPKITTDFYRYEGSLTTPTCNEIVVWTIFTESISISERQLRVFRSLRTEEGDSLVNNFRPPQPLCNRHVYLNSDWNVANRKKVANRHSVSIGEVALHTT